MEHIIKLLEILQEKSFFNRLGHTLNGKYRKLQSDIPGVDEFDQNVK